MEKKKIYIIDDHAILREGLIELINKSPEMMVCGEAATAEEALERIPEASPDLVLVDLSLPGMSGMDLVPLLTERHPGIRLLVLTMYDEHQYAERAVRAGARGYIMKHQVAKELRMAMQAVLAGELYLSPTISQSLLEAALKSKPPAGENPARVLSDREMEVFRHIGQGKGTTEIARHLGLHLKTIETYQARIKEKLLLRDSAQLFQEASRWINQPNP